MGVRWIELEPVVIDGEVFLCRTNKIFGLWACDSGWVLFFLFSHLEESWHFWHQFMNCRKQSFSFRGSTRNCCNPRYEHTRFVDCSTPHRPQTEILFSKTDILVIQVNIYGSWAVPNDGLTLIESIFTSILGKRLLLPDDSLPTSLEVCIYLYTIYITWLLRTWFNCFHF